MVKTLTIFLLLFNLSFLFAQNEKHIKVVDTFIMNFNGNNYEEIYQSFSPRMQSARTKQYYFNFFAKVKNTSGAILFLELLKYSENSHNKSRAEYNATLENENVTIKITVDTVGKIIGLYILRNKLLL